MTAGLDMIGARWFRYFSASRGIISEFALSTLMEVHPSVLMEVSQEGAMDTPANGARPPQDVVVSTRYIYTLALALVGLALATIVILFLLIDF